MGEYAHSVDAKGRVIMPAKFRDELGTSFVVTRGLEGCLSVYTQEGWARFATGMQKLQASKENVRAFKRFLFGSAAELEFDKQKNSDSGDIARVCTFGERRHCFGNGR